MSTEAKIFTTYMLVRSKDELEELKKIQNGSNFNFEKVQADTIEEIAKIARQIGHVVIGHGKPRSELTGSDFSMIQEVSKIIVSEIGRAKDAHQDYPQVLEIATLEPELASAGFERLRIVGRNIEKKRMADSKMIHGIKGDGSKWEHPTVDGTSDSTNIVENELTMIIEDDEPDEPIMLGDLNQ